MKRLTTDKPQDNMEISLNLFFVKDRETWVRGGGSAPDYPDVTLFAYIRDIFGRFLPEAKLPTSDDDLSFMLTEWLFFGTEELEGVIATLYNQAWAFAEIRERLAAYEDLGLKPDTIRKLLEACATFCGIYEGGGRERLRVLAQAQHDGRLFMSPVKVGDMLWPICWDRVPGEWVVYDQPERVNEVGTMGFFVSATYGEPEEIEEFHPYEEIGDVYFLSHEEAVAAAAVKERP